MNTQTVSPQTARLLADAGFPQPAPAPGQWWSNGEKLIFVFRKWLDVKWEYIGVIEHLETAHPGVNRYYDNEDFTGLVYLPTAGDILREIHNHFAVMSGCSVSVELSTTDDGFQVDIFEDLAFDGMKPIWEMHESEHEAAAMAWLGLELRERK